MFLKRTVRRNGTMTNADFRSTLISTIKSMLNEIGVNAILEYEGSGVGVIADGYVPGFPKTCGKIKQYRGGAINPLGTNFYNTYSMQFNIDGVNYVLGFYHSGDDGCFSFCNEFTDLGKTDYYNCKEGVNTNFLGCRSGISIYKMFATDTRIFLTLCRNEVTKTFTFIGGNDKTSEVAVICHSEIDNSGPEANNGSICLPHMNGTLSSRKDYGVTEEHFRMINPISFYGSEAFDYVDNIDKINNKAYIQKPLVAMYKRGIVAEIKGLYYSTIKAPKIGDVVSMGGITYIYIGAGLYFKNEV